MTTSTVPQLKHNLLAALKAEADLHGVQVSWGWPKSPTREMIVLGDVPEHDRQYVSLGRLSQEEDYVLEVGVRVERPGVDQEAATTRAYELVAVLEGVVKADMTFGGIAREGAFLGSALEEFVGSTDEARIAVVTCRVSVKARLA